MFCHDSSSLLFSERKNSTIVSTRARKRWERPEGGERAGHRLHHDRICACHDRGKAGIHLRVRVAYRGTSAMRSPEFHA